jgi:hypothetical protein
MKLVKLITAFVMLVAFALPLLTTAILQVQQLYAQWQMLEALEKKELITISVTTKDIQWVRLGKECLIDGELFDVKTSVAHGDKIFLSGLYDAKEKTIQQQLAKQAKQQEQNGKAASLVKLLLLIAIQAKDAGSILQPANFSLACFRPYTPLIYHPPFNGCNTPPPRYS